MDSTNDPQTLLVIGAPEHDAAAYHLSGFLAPDPVIYLRAAGKGYLAVSSMEYGRAKRDARVDEVLSFDELEVMSLARGLRVTPDARLFANMRRAKSAEEISYIEKTQRAVEEACALAVRILEEAGITDDGTLLYGDEPLTSERLRSEIDVELLRRGCAADGTIAAGGAQAADPHERGHGPLRAGEPIILDIFPVDKASRYYADMTRTFVKGEPSEELQQMYDAVLESQEAALAMIRAGVNGRDVHKRVSDVLHEAGYKTLVHDQEPGEPLQEGFIHGTGHGVGLEIHEAPRVSTADEKLVPGDVVTVEPGLYYPGIGGVRIEDLVVVTEDGCRNLTSVPKEFRL